MNAILSAAAAVSTFATAAAHIRAAITALRHVGYAESNGKGGEVIADLERIHGLCCDGGKLAADRIDPTVSKPAVTTPIVPVTTAPTTSKPTVSKPASRMAKSAAHSCKHDGTVRSKPTVAANAGVATPAVKPAAPKSDGLADYRKLQTACKAAGLSAKGTAEELRARLASKPEAKPAAPVAPENKPDTVELHLTVTRDKVAVLSELANLDTDTLHQLLMLGIDM